jgi:hypothetical protein
MPINKWKVGCDVDAGHWTGEECVLSRDNPGRVGAAVFGMLLMLLPAASAQGISDPLPPPSETQAQAGTATISGTVVDSDGDAIPSALVTVVGGNLIAPRKAVADKDGYFSLEDLPSGKFELSVVADGFEPTVRPVALQSGEDVRTPNIVLAVATANTDVEVSLTRHDMAEEDIHMEEKQRLIGFIPNFYVVYDWTAPALSPKQKFKLAWRASIDPANFILAGIIAGGEQAANAFSGYGQGAQGYGKRFGAAVGDGTIGGFIGGAIMPTILHQDPRYFYKGTGTILHRALYAISSAVICRGDNGKWQPNYSSVIGDVASGAISNTYYPASDRSGAVLVIENGFLNAAEDGFGNLLQEFVFKRISTGIPKSVPSTPAVAPAAGSH